MEYDITIGGKPKKVKLERLGDNLESYLVQAEERQGRIVVHEREPERMLLSIDNKMFSVIELSRSQSAVSFIANGEHVSAEITGSARKLSEVYSGIASVGELVISNFPAKVVKVSAKVGSSLQEDETILILEAMKMDAMIKAPKSCKVLEVYVKEGDIVEKGKKLARLEFSG